MAHNCGTHISIISPYLVWGLWPKQNPRIPQMSPTSFALALKYVECSLQNSYPKGTRSLLGWNECFIVGVIMIEVATFIKVFSSILAFVFSQFIVYLLRLTISCHLLFYPYSYTELPALMFQFPRINYTLRIFLHSRFQSIPHPAGLLLALNWT